MKNKLMLGMLCVALLMCSLPVSAATNNACQHNFVSNDKYISSKYKDNYYHTSTYQQRDTCTKCDVSVTGDNIEKTEIHLVSVTNSDLGHTGSQHRFNVLCSRCNQSYILTIACEGNQTGTHVHP